MTSLRWGPLRPARRAVVSGWARDPRFGGAYSHLRPAGSGADRRRLAEPVAPGLVLAGEATDVDYPATLHGAWRSGERAARQLLAVTAARGTSTDRDGDAPVVVIGAGIAGLVAGGCLAEAGRRVVVLEASSVPGGRGTADRRVGGPVHLAAGWVHGDVDNPVGARLATLGIDTAPAPWETMATFVAGIGRLGPEAEAAASAVVAQVEAALDEASVAAAADAPLGPALRDALAAAVRAGADDTSVRVAAAWLRTEYENVYSGRLDDLPLARRVEPFRMAGEDRTIVGPLDRLIEDLAAPLDVRYGCEVVLVRSSATPERRGAPIWECVLAGGDVIGAAAVVVAVPLGPLQSGALRFEPSLGADVRAALDHLGMGSVAKVVATFDERFWVPDEAFVVVDDAPVALEVWVDVTALVGMPALCGFATGDAADAIELLDEDGARRAVDEHLSRIVASGR